MSSLNLCDLHDAPTTMMSALNALGFGDLTVTLKHRKSKRLTGRRLKMYIRVWQTYLVTS